MHHATVPTYCILCSINSFLQISRIVVNFDESSDYMEQSCDLYAELLWNQKNLLILPHAGIRWVLMLFFFLKKLIQL